MTQAIERSAWESAATETRREVPGTLWRVAGGLAFAHIVLLFAGSGLEKSPLLSDTPEVVKRTFAGANVGQSMVGGYLESLSFLVLLPVLVFVARVIGRRTEAGRWATQTALAAGVSYVVITLATAIPAGAGALYGAHHGGPGAATLAVVDNVRNFAFYVSILALGAHALGVGVAAVTDRVMRRWVGFGGIVVGIVLLGGVVVEGLTGGGAALGVPFLLWVVWFIGLGVGLIRRGSVTA